jgi:cytochrome c2
MRFPRASAALALALGALASACGDGSTGLGSTPYDRADVVRGGISYDLYWNAATGFSQTSPLIANFSSRSDFFRCKQCHGWDQLGSRGFYVSRGPRTSRPNISSVDLAALSRTSTPQELFDAIKTGSGTPRRAPTVDLSTYDPAVDPTIGDQMPDVGAFMSDAQIWDLVKFLREDALDVTQLYDMTVVGTYPTGSATFANIGKDGNAALGQAIYAAQCAYCHGVTGTAITLEGQTLGAFTRSKPHEVQHKVRYGQLGSTMRPTRLTLTEMKHLYRFLADTVAMPQ